MLKIVLSLAFTLQSAHADAALTLYERGEAEVAAARKIQTPSLRQKELYKAISTLQQFVELYPYNEKSPDTLYELGTIYQELYGLSQDRDLATQANHYFKEITMKFPQSPLADNALFQIAQICKNTFQDEKCAADSLHKMKSDYPSGDMTTTASQLKNMEITETPEEVHFSFEISGKKEVRGKVIPADPANHLPQRYYFDVDHLDIPSGFALSKSFSADSPVFQIRYGKNQGSVRVVFDLAKGVDGQKISLKTIDKGFDIKIPKVSPKTEAVVEVTKVEPKIDLVEIPHKYSRKRIVLDAGHGGEDPGAKGKKGTEEKTICLAIVKKVEELLRKRPEYEIFLTRREDVFIPLAKRTTMANDWGGELFVSVHANASPKRDAEGVSTYFLDNHDDAEALRVAERENEEPGKVIARSPVTSENQYLEIMKASMVKNFHTVQSADFAQFVQTQLLHELRRDFSGVSDLGVKSARFFVLTGAKMPAILIETSFISNVQEEKRLKDGRYQKSMAEAVVKGIDQFFKSSIGRGDHAALFK